MESLSWNTFRKKLNNSQSWTNGVELYDKVAADHVVFNESWGGDKRLGEDTELVSPHQCIKNTSTNETVLTEHCWTLAEDIRLLGQEGSLPNWVGWKKEKGRGEAAGWDMRPRARAEGKGMLPCLGSTVNSQEGQWRRKGPFRRDRTRAQQPSTQEDQGRRAHAVREPPSVWPSLGVCSPMQTGAGAWDTGLESRPGDRATAGGEETACGGGSEEAWNPECLRGDPVHLRREAPKPCRSRGAASIAASLPMCWTYLQNRNWVTG